MLRAFGELNLETAIRLYRQLGFREIELPGDQNMSAGTSPWS
jgi:hypothetical protein